jgi:hypothetical protein
MDIIEIGLYATYGLVAFGCVAAIILPLINAFSNPKALLRSLAALILLAVLFAVSYSVADNEVTLVGTKEGLTTTGSQIIGGALILTYLLGGLAIVATFISEVSKVFR